MCLTDSWLQALGRRCKLRGCGQMTEAGLSAVAAGCSRLRDMGVDVHCGNDALLVQAEHCRDLRAEELRRQWGSEAPRNYAA
jgi:hypothetical protein